MGTGIGDAPLTAIVNWARNQKQRERQVPCGWLVSWPSPYTQLTLKSPSWNKDCQDSWEGMRFLVSSICLHRVPQKAL